MDEELKGIVQNMINAGEPEDAIASVIKAYKPKIAAKTAEPKPITEKPKKLKAEGNGGLASPSASTDSLWGSQKPANPIEETFQKATNPTTSQLLDNMPDRGLSARERAAKELRSQYQKEGVKNFTITPEEVDQQAYKISEGERRKIVTENIKKINSTKNTKEQRTYFENLMDNIALSSTELGVSLASIPETLYDIAAIPQNVFAKITGLDTSASSKKFKESTGVSNPLLDIYVDETAKLKTKVEEFDKNYESTSVYENLKNGNIGDAFELLGTGIARSSATSLSMMAGGAYTSVGKLAAAGTLAMTGSQRLEVEKNNPELTELDKTIKSLGLAGAETVFSAVSSGTMGKVYKEILLKEGSKEAAGVVFRDGLIKMYGTALKKYGGVAGALGEGVEEVATTITQNMIEGRPAFENVADSFIQGAGGGAIYGAPLNVIDVASKIKTGYENRQIDKIIESDTNPYDNIQGAFDPKAKELITTDKIKLVEAKGSLNKLQKELDKSLKQGAITEEESKGIVQEFLDTNLALSKTKGIELTDVNKTKAVDLIRKKEVLKAEVKEMDDALALPKKEQIKLIDEQLLGLATPKPEVVEEVAKDDSETPDNGSSIVDETVVDKVPATREDVVEASPEDYAASMDTAMKGMEKTDNKVNLQVEQLSVEQAKEIVDEGGKLFMTSDGKSGAYVKADGYMGGLFKDPSSNLKEVGKVLQQARLEAGGKYFDAFGTKLEDIYIENGFVPVARVKFDEDNAPKGWDAEDSPLKDKPDNVYFAYDPNSKVKKGSGSLVATHEEGLRIAKSHEARTGKQNTEFFTGKAKEASSKVPYKPVIEVDQTTPVAKAYNKFSSEGNFTGHISKMIAGFAEKQKQVAEAIVKGGFKSFLDIGTSEGGMIKTVASQNPEVKAVGIDPNAQMKDNFNATEAVPNAEFRQEAWQASWTEEDGTVIPEFKTEDKFEVVNEDFAFQFMNNNREQQVKGVKEVMTPDGVFITSEKFHTDNQEANEKKKYDHQKKYFDASQLTEDKQTIVNGMADDMVRDTEYYEILKKNFKHVQEFWNAGNFKGYIASDNKAKLDEFINNVGDLSSEFTDAKSKTNEQNESKGKTSTASDKKGTDRGSTGNVEGLTEDQKRLEDLENSKKWMTEKKESSPAGLSKNQQKMLDRVTKEIESLKEKINAPEPKIETKQKAKEIAEKVRKLKINKDIKSAMSNLNSRPTALVELAWDGAIEVVATTVELTGDLAQAIESGLSTLKSSKWYQGLSEKGQKMAERKYRDMFRDEIREIEKSQKKQGFFDKLNQSTGQKFVDVFTNVNRELRDLQGFRDLYKRQGLFESRAANEIDAVLNKVKDHLKVISKSRFNTKQVADYMYAVHALERNAYIEQNVDTENPFGSGMLDQRARLIIDQYTTEEIKEMDRMTKPFYDILEDSRKRMVDSGLISQEAMDELRTKNDFYVPLTGFADEQIELGDFFQSNKVSVKGREFRKMAGRSTEAGDVISNIIKQASDIAIRASKNEVLQEFRNIKKKNPDDVVPFTIHSKETLPEGKTVNSKGEVAYVKDRAQLDDSYIGFKDNGEQKYIRFENPVLAQNLNRATDSVVDSFTKWGGKLNRFLSASFTQYNPAFMIPNFFRDLQTALINLKAQADINPDLKGQDLSAKALKNLRNSIATIHADERGSSKNSKMNDYYQEFKEEGAKTGWANRMSLKEINLHVENISDMFGLQEGASTGKKVKTTLNKGWNSFSEVVNNANTSIENGIRLATYSAARDAGLSKLDAASLAKELTVNFNRKGEVGGLMNTLYLFFNASVQGTSTFKKNMLKMKTYEDSQGRIRKTLNRGQKAAIAVQMASFALALFNLGVSGEDEESEMSFYEAIPDYEKERNIIIMSPDGSGKYAKIPLPYGYNIFSNLGTMLAEVTMGNRKVSDAGSFLLGNMIGSFVPFSKPEGSLSRKLGYSALPTVLAPEVMLFENKDNFNNDIYRENFPVGDQKLATASLGSKNTPDLYKKTAIMMNSLTGGNEYQEGLLGFHPDKAEFIIDYFGGGALKFLKDTYGGVEKGLKVANGANLKIESRKIPLLNKVYGEDTNFPERNIYYDVKENYKSRLNYLENTKEGKEEGDPDLPYLRRLDNAYDESDKALKELRAVEKAILLKEDSVEKLEKLEDLELRKNKVYSKLVKRYLSYREDLEGNYE